MNSNRGISVVQHVVGNRRILFAVIGSVIVISALLLFAFRNGRSGPEYRTEPVTRGDITASVTATGTVNAVTTVLVGTQVSGTIRNLYVDFNSKVRKGQVIAQIDPSIFEAQAQQQRANLSVARANVEKAEAGLIDAKRSLDRNTQLLSKNLIPRSDLDSATTNYDSAKAQLSAAKAQVEQTKAALDFAETNLRYTKILSPVDGVVISRNVDVGQTVAASFQTPTLFTIAQDLTKMQIDTNVAESDIGVARAGQDADFTVDAYTDFTFKGKVSQIRRAPITVQNVVTYDVVVLVNNQDLKLMPGMTANVSIIIVTKKDVLRIPNAALRFRPPDRTPGRRQQTAGSEKKGPGIWILENGKPKRIGIGLGISDGAYTEVVSGDLKEGQSAIVEAVKKSKSESQSGPRMF
jgi:HlyD family secretion protein